MTDSGSEPAISRAVATLPWIAHLLQDLAESNPTLVEAELQQDTEIRDRAETENADLRSAITDTRVALGSVRSELDGALDSIRIANHDKEDLRGDLAEARETINRLETELSERGSTPRPRKQARRLDSPPTYTPSSPTSTMNIDRTAGDSFHCVSPSISRIGTSDPTAPSSPQPSLISRVARPLSARIGDPEPSIHFAPSPFLRSVGFFALLPVIVNQPGVPLWAADDSAPLAADGEIDFSAHERYVFTFGRWNGDEPAWTTTMVRREFFLTPAAVSARSSNLSLPIRDVVIGGRNGSLVSTAGDPTTEAEMEALLRNPSRAGRAAGFIERVRFTPPELRCEFHNRALEHWDKTRKGSNRETRKTRFEPPPSASINAWKSWLKQIHEDAIKNDRSPTICGIPRVEDEYQDGHIEGAKAIIALTPLTPKGFAVRGRIREPFMRAAAMLLCEPGGYTRITNQLNTIIASTRTDTRYDELVFGKLATITPNTFARYAAMIGVTAKEAETWRPWAMAYIAMELEERPHSEYATDLLQARDAAHAIIDSDPKWVTTSIHPDSPGNYKPVDVQPQTSCLDNTTQTPKYTAGIRPSNTAWAESDDPDTEDRMETSLTEHCFYDFEEDNEAMGPVIN